ncbi:MAG: type I secretion C-terminal target domain-containing protein [Alphaproteobacteria bacterium]|nr:type I secretion C-terminal target domain-containing protein [Alphaproteobacteria bacterium]
MAIINGTANNDSLNGTASNDTINGLAGTDIIIANAGNDTLNGGLGADIMNGGLGNDVYVVDDAGDIVNENAGEGTDLVQSSISYTLANNVENLTLTGVGAINGTGNALNNTITGNTGVNTLDGGMGNDTLNGMAGADVMIGGQGNDVFIVDNVGDVVSENASEGTDLVQSSISYTLAANIENLTLTGTGVINGTGNSDNNTIIGNSAKNVLTGGDGNDLLNGLAGNDTMIGGLGDDTFVVESATDVVSEASGEGTDTVQSSITYTLAANVENLTLTGTTAINGTGNADNNVITGNAGNNTLDGGAGADTLIGGLGNDTYIIDNVGDVISENASAGTDLVRSAASYTLGANLENLTLTGTGNVDATGNTLVNTLTGNTGNNTLDGGVGADVMIGGTGNDTYVVDNIADKITEGTGAGTDTVMASVTYTLGTNLENATLTGTANINVTGNTLNNTLTGNTGNNTLSGGTGADVMIGGDGNDTYIVDNVGDVVSEAANEGTDTVSSAASYTLGANIENLILTGTGAISGTGNTLDNAITGNSGVNILTGDAGNDTLNGMAGADTMIGGQGNDTYYVDSTGDVINENSGEGSDTVITTMNYTLSANIENLTLNGTAAVGTGNADDNVITGNASNNTLNGMAGADTMIGGLGNDIYVVDDAGDVVSENAASGTDTVQASITYSLASLANIEHLTLTGTADINATGNALANTLAGNSGANTLDGGAGADTMIGGLGDDVYIVDSSGDIISEGVNGGIDEVRVSANYTLASNLENLVLTGASAINGTGNTANNTITGNIAANTLNGGSGADTMIGGDGNDTYFVDNVGDVVVENAGEGTDTVNSTVTYTLGADVENLVLSGTAAISGTGNALNNTLTGNATANTLDGGAGADVMIGGAGNDVYIVDNAGDVVSELVNGGIDTVQSDVTFSIAALVNVENLTLTGTADNNATGNILVNVLTGNSGANTLDGGAGADTMAGGAGDDTYIVDSTSDVVVEASAAGTDSVQSSVTFTLANNIENLTLTGAGAINATGNADINILTGNAANNTLNGMAGADTMVGGDGDDTYIVDNVGDSITELASEGTDTVLSSVTYTLGAEVENLTLTGSGSINGTGNAAANVLTGNASANTLDGGAGVDTMIGGLGNDTYIVDDSADIVSEAASAGTDLVQASVSYTLSTNVENLTLTGAGAIDGTGNAATNVITGNAAANTLDGGAGVDTLIGGDGDDTYVVDVLGDVVSELASEGTDTVMASISYTLGANVENLVLTGVATLSGTGNAGVNTITGNSGANTLNGMAGADTMIGGQGGDTYVIDDAGDTIVENVGEGADTAQSSISYTLGANVESLVLTGTANINGTGNADANTLTGNAGNNTLDGGAGVDTMIGGLGDDTYLIDDIADSIVENANGGVDTVRSAISYTIAANVENLILTGTANIDGTGNAGVNQLIGNSGNNTLDGGASADAMLGGDGDDTYIVDDVNDVVIENANEGTDLIESSISYNMSSLLNIENLTLTDVAAINATGNTSDNTITGNTAVNTLDGGQGADTLIGGAGNDVYIVDNIGDAIVENLAEGTDIVQSSVDYTLSANVENLVLNGTSNLNGTGNASVNILTGNSGDNTLDGAGGADTMIGGLGNDTYIVDIGTDVISENASEGTDTVMSSNSYTLGANLENLVLTGAGNLNGTGNALVNTITGTTGNNVLNGAAGADTMIGGNGNDTYAVDDVGDVVVENSSEGTDTVQSSISYVLSANIENLTLTGAASINGTGNTDVNILTGNNGNNTLDGDAGADTMIGGVGNDTYIVDDAGDVVSEGAGAGTDTVMAGLTYTLASLAAIENLTLTGTGNFDATGNTLNNIITGNSGNNTLNGGTGADTMIGGAGDDTYLVDSAGDVLIELAGDGTETVSSSVTFTLSANIENLVLTGAANIDGSGNAEVNTITGNTGNNTLDGGAGADIMIGGTGNDTYIVDDAGDVVSENAAGGTDTIQSSTSYSIAALANVENITLIGGDSSTATGNAGVNVLTGNAADNTLDGGAGADTMIGGLGNDTYIVDSATDLVSENASEGTDIVMSSVTYTLVANVENLTLTGSSAINGTGNALNNTIVGNSGNNTLDGLAGADTMSGGAGNDTYTVDNAGDVVIELAGAGTDLVNSSVSYTLSANVDNLTLTGATNINATGNDDVNTLTGNTGNNTLDGGMGADVMIGGTGNDTYIVDDAGDVVSEAAAGGTDLVLSSVSFSVAALANVENITLIGAGNIDATGNTGANTLTGNGANNTLDGGTGADTMIGGLGNDTYVVDNAGDIVSENASEGTDTVLSSLTYTLLANFENLTLTGVTAINGTGNSAVNIITGNSAANVLNGLAGADTMIGGAGNDSYTVDDAGDVIVENLNEGTDSVSSSVSYTLSAYIESLTLTGSSNINATGNVDVNTLTGNTGDNTLDGGEGADTMIGGAGNDTYVVENVGDIVSEGAGAGTDLVMSSINYSIAALANVENITLTGTGNINATGNTGANTLTGNSGNNTLDGGTGADTMIGGLGDDSYVVDNAGDVVSEGASAGTDTVLSSLTFTLGANFENLVLTGAGVIDGTGNAADNTLTGNTANNTLNGMAGADIMIGGAGNDFYIVDNIGDVVSEIAGEGTDTVQSSVTFSLAVTNAENLTLTGSSNIDATGNNSVNTLTGNSGNNTLDGGVGADTMIGGLGNDTYFVDNSGDVVTENLGEGTDNVRSSISYTLGANLENLTLTGSANINATGNSGNNIITGNSGDNTIDGGAGNDTMIGGAGNDTYIVDSATDVVSENAAEGTDTVQSGVTWVLGTNLEHLTLTGAGNINGTGNSAANTLTGNTGSNTLDGGAGADVMIGGTGNDTYIVDNLGDTVSENAASGTDGVQSSVSFTLSANIENLTLTGSADTDGIGNSLANTIIGNSGSNTVAGGGGADVLTGGLSDDVFLFDAATAYGGIDTITDFNTSEGDAINIADLLTGNYDPMLHALTDFVRFSDSGGDTIVEIDRDGAGTGYGFTQVATLTGVTGLTDEDALVLAGNLIVT